MLAALDHIVICTETLLQGVEEVETALRVPMSGGGSHVGMGTHNRLLSLGPETYLEVIAPNPSDPNPKRSRMFDLDCYQGGPMLNNWVLRTQSVSATMRNAPENLGEILPLSRGDFRWLMTVPPDGKLPFEGAFPALIEWQSAHPAPMLPDVGCQLIGLEITHPEAKKLSDALAPILSDPRVSISTGPGISMRAEIDTPSGIKVLQ